ncbi:MAG: leucyl/phenylalanyl-tRNA--protein transferase, partial [Alphaproteobacteria bacterium]|nr:leucyl/phenylalanyl-tRNA--protein transferase [Alphaproteobacteria bacterium]
MQPLRPQRFRLTPGNVIEAYRHGLFPMAEDRNDPRLYWIEPELRGVIPLKGFH